MVKLVKLSGSLLLLVLLTTLVSCEALFTTNLFGDLDKLDLSNMSDHEKAVTVLYGADEVIEGMSSSQIAALVSDLNALAADTSQDDSTRMQAAAASSAVQMSSSGADDTINNLGDLATDIVNSSLTIDSPDDFLTAIFSDSNGNPLSAAQIEAQLDSMIAAAAALETYGDLLGTVGEAPNGVSADTIAITAIVVGLVNKAGNAAELAKAIVDPNDVTLIDTTPNNGTPDVFDNLPTMDALAANPVDELFGAGSGLANVINGSESVTSMLDIMNQ